MLSPSIRSVSAARALVSSAFQLQYVTTGLARARSCSTLRSTDERGIQIAPGMCSVAKLSSSRTSTTVTVPFEARTTNSSIGIPRDGSLSSVSLVSRADAVPVGVTEGVPLGQGQGAGAGCRGTRRGPPTRAVYWNATGRLTVGLARDADRPVLKPQFTPTLNERTGRGKLLPHTPVVAVAKSPNDSLSA